MTGGRAVKVGRNLLAGSAAVASAATIGIGKAKAAPETPTKPVPTAIQPGSKELSLYDKNSESNLEEQSPQEVIDKYNSALADLAEQIISSPGVKPPTTITRGSGSNIPVGTKIYSLSIPSPEQSGAYDVLEVIIGKGFKIPFGITISVGSMFDKASGVVVPRKFLSMGAGYAFKHYPVFKNTPHFVGADGPISQLKQGFFTATEIIYDARPQSESTYTVSDKVHQPFMGYPLPPFGEGATLDSKINPVKPDIVKGFFDGFLKKGGSLLGMAKK